MVEGKRVRLELDVEERTVMENLAYVYVDDLMVNEWLVANGYARGHLPPIKYVERFNWKEKRLV